MSDGLGGHVLTVGALRAALTDVPDEMAVVLAGDAEGNRYSPLAEATQAMYRPESTWSGDTFITPEERAEPGGEDYLEAPEDAIRVVVLWPVN